MTALANPGWLAPTDTKIKPVALSRPGWFERSYVCVTLFLLFARLPNEWFDSARNTTGANDNASQGILPTLVFAALFGVAILLLAGNWHIAAKIVQAEPLLPAFIFLCLASTLWSADPNITGRRSLAFALTTVFAYYLVVRFSLADIMRLTALVLAAVVLINLVWIVALPEYGKIGSDFGINSNSFTGIHATKNELGIRMVLSLTSFLLMARTNRRFRVGYYGMAAVCGYIVIASNSKTSLANTILLAGMLLVYLGFRSRRTLFGAVAVAMIGGGTIATLLVTANLTFFTAQLDRDITLSGRTDLWASLFEEITDRPLLGYGWSAFWQGFFSPSHEVWIAHDWLPPHGHNAFLDITLQVGLVGLAIFLAIFVRAVVRATRHIRDTRSAIGLFPLTMLSLTLLTSITESGVLGRSGVWVLFVIAVLVVTKDSRASIALDPDRRLDAENR